MIKYIKLFFLFFMIITITWILSPFLIRSFMLKYIKPEKNQLPSSYTCLVLGAGVYRNGEPSQVLKDRLINAKELYKSRKIARILLSGDHGQTNYDEVNNMRLWLTKQDVPDSVIFLDHAGFNTYSSIVRAKKVFLVDDVIIVTQRFHLYRAVFIARCFGLRAYGFSANLSKYKKADQFKIREYFALLKAGLEVLFRPQPKYLGDPIPITGNSKKSHG